jgi:hypothetical protein
MMCRTVRAAFPVLMSGNTYAHNLGSWRSLGIADELLHGVIESFHQSEQENISQKPGAFRFTRADLLVSDCHSE